MNGRRERQPHLFGASSLHYRQGGAVANVDTPPVWAPEYAFDPEYNYTLEEYHREVLRWCGATRVHEDRQGNLLALALGGAARSLVDDIANDVLRDGADADFLDGRGWVHRTGVEILFHALFLHFPTDVEAQMLRTGIEFFNFTPRQGEILRAIFHRFDTMLDRANRLAELGISFPFRTWMLLSLLQLSPRRWTELLKDMQHHFPRNMQEYKALQNAMVRERSLEDNVHNLQDQRSVHGDGQLSQNRSVNCGKLV